MGAEVYHCAGFIASDPVQFPHRYTLKQDIEISGLLTAIMSFGNRKQILKKADELHKLMGTSPYQYVLSRRWEEDFPSGATHSFYRMLSYADFHGYFRRLYTAYTQFGSLEDALNIYSGIPMEKLCAFLEVSAKSPQKKLNMFLRWMIRRDSEVDLGVWESFDRKDLIVPLDTHVCRVAYYFKLTDTETFSLKNARRITAALAEVFQKDFQGHTTILRNSLFKLSSSGSRVKLENPDFEKTFDVYSTDQIEARYLLSPSMMERLLALDREFNKNITISFRDSNILIAIPESRNHFEASIWKPMDDLSQLKNDCSSIHALVSIVEDLNLNTRIWSKK